VFVRTDLMKRYSLHITTDYPERIEDAEYVYDVNGFEIGHINLTNEETD
jgi:hypothetical protein